MRPCDLHCSPKPLAGQARTQSSSGAGSGQRPVLGGVCVKGFLPLQAHRHSETGVHLQSTAAEPPLGFTTGLLPPSAS